MSIFAEVISVCVCVCVYIYIYTDIDTYISFVINALYYLDNLNW
jgi:hypothetical protein